MKAELSPDHPSLGISFDNLATAYAGKGRHEVAIEYKQKYLANRQKILLPNDPTIGDYLSDIGNDYEQLREQKMALKYYTETLAVYEKSLSNGHPALAKTHRDIQRVSEMDSKKTCSVQ